MTPKFMWMEGARWIGYEFWATIIIYNTPNGIGKVEQGMPESMGGGWYANTFPIPNQSLIRLPLSVFPQETGSHVTAVSSQLFELTIQE